MLGAMADTHERDLATHPKDGRDPPVLVAFASKHGSTRGVALRIAARLRDRGETVELRPAGQIADAGAFAAIVLGSAVFNQRWTAEAEQFIERNAEALATRPVWLFSVGSFGDRKRIIGPLMKREPKDIRALEAAIHPRGYRVFAGVIHREQWPLGSRLFYHALGGRLGDNRDWSDIDAWADGIGRALRAERSRARMTRAA
jgi:menaquinone-dependent protoporphyrinogen oxidase